MKNIVVRKYSLAVSIILLLAIIVACVPILNLSTPGAATQMLINQAIEQTVTARAFEQANSGQELVTAFAHATALSQTITAQAVLENVHYPETATAAFPVLQDLRHYGISPFDGNVAWLHKPVTISLSGPNQYGYANDYPQITAKDFVIASDVTWKTDNGLAGCGFVFRSDGNTTTPNQLLVLISRFAEGTVGFSAMTGGNVTNMNNYYPWVKDKSFSWQNNATNRLVIIVRANLIDIYTNGVLVAEADTTKPPPTRLNLPVIPQLPENPTTEQVQAYQQLVNQYQLDISQLSDQLVQAEQNYYSNKIASLKDGFIGFAASSSSGTATCTFNNAWLFLFNQPPTLTPTITPTFNGTPYTSTPTSTLTPTPTNLPVFTPIPTRTFVIVAPPTAAPTDVPTAAPTEAPTATQPPVPTATQPPVPTATAPPVTP
jgi:hypothetical protein